MAEDTHSVDTKPARLGAAQERRLAVLADADPRSVRREYEHPGTVRGMTGERIRRVFAEHGVRP